MPCTDELIVNIVKDADAFQKTTVNTIRIECNTQTLGYTQREFRFHDVNMRQVEKSPVADIPIVSYFFDTAISLVKSFIEGDDASDEDTYKNFKNSAMFQVADIEVNPKTSFK